MTTYLLAGGGTAGHVNPLLATADALRAAEPDSTVLVLGTSEGLEARLVPERGYELLTIPKLPFPRRPNGAALAFPGRFRQTLRTVRELIADRGVDLVAGFGGYASAPAYLAARSTKRPLVLHEGNAKPGLANRLGARYTPYVTTTFSNTPLPHAQLVGMPLRREVTVLADPQARATAAAEAAAAFGLDSARPTLLVTGGSLGARRINAAVHAHAQSIVDAGWNVLHIAGARTEVADPGVPGYAFMTYCDRMDLALALADLAVSRAGASTVCELAVVGVPSVLVPYAVGNGEQRFNARDLVSAGGASIIADSEFTADRFRESVLPLLADRDEVGRRAAKAASVGIADGDTRLAWIIRSAARDAR